MRVSGRSLSAMVLALGVAAGPQPAQGSVTYSYSGNPFTTIVSGPPDGSRITGNVSFAEALAPNSNYTAADVIDFRFNDGAITIDESNARAGNNVFLFTTDAAGNIASWNVQTAYEFPLTLEVVRMTTFNEPDLVPIDKTEAVANGTYLGFVTNAPGIWMATAVPEPGTLALLGAGLVLIAVSRRRVIPAIR